MSLEAHVERIENNPFRSMSANPIQEPKIESLLESMQEDSGGFWDNIMARPAGNVEVEGLMDLANYDGPLELAYGHHRLETLRRMGVETINIIVKQLDDEQMLRVMANENKGDWNYGNMLVILETVDQVRQQICNSANAYDSYEDYVAAGLTFFTRAKDFTDSQNLANIGFKRTAKFLGETWSESDCRFAMNTLKAVEAGTVTREQITDMPSVGAMNAFQVLAETIRENGDILPYFQAKLIDDVHTLIIDPDKAPPVSAIKGCKKMAKEGKHPLKYLKTRSIVPFDMIAELVTLCEGETPVFPASDIPTIEGLGDQVEDPADLVKKVEEAIQAKLDRKVKAASKGGDDTGEEATGSSAEANAAIEAAESEVVEGSAGVTIEALEGLDEMDDEIAATPLGAMTATFIQSASTFAQQAHEVASKAPALEGDLLDRTAAAFEATFLPLVRLGLAIYGEQDLVRFVEKEAAPVEDDDE